MVITRVDDIKANQKGENFFFANQILPPLKSLQWILYDLDFSHDRKNRERIKKQRVVEWDIFSSSTLTYSYDLFGEGMKSHDNDDKAAARRCESCTEKIYSAGIIYNHEIETLLTLIASFTSLYSLG